MATDGAPSVFHMGQSTLKTDRRLLHGTNRQKVVEAMKAKLPAEKTGIILLQGGSPWSIYSTDTDGVFRQESYFHYLFGVNQEKFFGALDLRTEKAMLFMPRLPPEHAVWMGPIDTPDVVMANYAVDEVHYVDELAEILTKAKPPALHTLVGVNSDSSASTRPAEFKGIEEFEVETETLHPVMTEARVIKSRLEIDALKYANDIASAAHVRMMQVCKPGMVEYQLESAFLDHCYSTGGCRHSPYTPICASGPNGAVLHYGHAGAPNDRELQAGDMMLCDMGCEYHGYDSDITTSFPVSGKFTEDQRGVYNTVLRAHGAVIAAMKPGVSWPDMHRLATRTILEGLRENGFVKGDLDEMMAKHLGARFLPCGLGHLIGLDTHDVGGYGPGLPERIMQPGIKALRTARVLEAGMVLTVEPGCYFNSFLLTPALEDEELKGFLAKEKIKSFLGFGGVRLEDSVVVTAEGAYSITNVPREIADVEAVMAGGPWPPRE